MSSLGASIQRVTSSRSNTRETDTEPADGKQPHRGANTAEELSKEQLFDVLRNSRRRAVIVHLREENGELSVEELSRRVAADEYEIPESELSSEQYKRVYTGLYQFHLDKMDELGVLEFDSDRNVVSLRSGASQFEPYLGRETSVDSARKEFSVAAVVALIVLFGSTGVGPIGTLSPTVLALLTVSALVGVATLHIYSRVTG